MPRHFATLVVLLLPAAAWAAPPAVVELFEDDTAALIPKLTMGGIGGGEDVKVEAESADVFAGKAALRVAAAQRFSPDVPGWDFRIAETPKPGEYRYLRFAWKKVGEGPLMVQFHTRQPTADWVVRYHTGGHPPWPAKVVAAEAPGDWAVVTRDLFADFGAVTLGGIAFTPYTGGDGLFDHILLGRTLPDLDRATAAIMLKTPPNDPLADARLKQLWDQLGSSDACVGDAARWTLVRGHKEAVPFLLRTATVPDGKGQPVDEAKVRPLIADLTHYRHLTRAAAGDELRKLGPGVLPHVRKATEAAEEDAKARLRAFLDDWAAQTAGSVLRLRRCAAVLRAVGSPEAKDLLAKIQASLP